MSYTFQFNQVNPIKLFDFESNSLTDCLREKKFFDHTHDKVIITSTPIINSCLPCLDNGLLGTIYRSYSQHVPLVLRPDDLWLGIVLNFGRYVKTHSQELRDLFVDHAGRKELVIVSKRPYLKYTTQKDWQELIDEMAHKISLNTKKNLNEWMGPNFSTTNQKDRMVAKLALMASVNEYFEMKFEMSCGLSQVTLQGTLEDWKMLYQKAHGLYQFNVQVLTDWADLLLPVLHEFIQAYNGQVNEDFWQRICTNEPRGSGGQKNFRGWFLVFSPFDEHGKYLLNPFTEVQKSNIYAVINDDQIADCAINVSITIDDHVTHNNNGTGQIHHVIFYAGLLMTQYNQKKNTLAPTVDWIMIGKKQITYLDLEQSLIDFLNKHYAKNPHKQMLSIKLLQFAHYVASKCHFPNDHLMDLVDNVIAYPNDSNNQNTSDHYKQFLEFLAQDLQFSYKPNIFAKYIDPNQLHHLLQSYVEPEIESFDRIQMKYAFQPQFEPNLKKTQNKKYNPIINIYHNILKCIKPN